MSKHTPGPWRLCASDPLMFGAASGNGTEPLGFVYGPSFPEQSDHGRTCLANARLIAAAPELLEAAQMVLAWYEAENDHKGTTFWERVEMCASSEGALRAAIAKATGEEA